MYILIFMIVSIALGFFFLKQLDQKRWQRYQIERDLYFRQHPYPFPLKNDFAVHVLMNKTSQFNLVNGLMLKSVDQSILKNALIQRIPAQTHHRYIIKVMIEEISIGYLDKTYAERFCQSLEETDFFIGRPIATLAEISFCELKPNVQGCRVKLDLPSNPHLASLYLMQSSDMKQSNLD